MEDFRKKDTRPLIVFPLPHFRSVLRRLAGSPRDLVLCPVGVQKDENELRYLVRFVAEGTAERERVRSLQAVTVTALDTEPGLASFEALFHTPNVVACIGLGHGAYRGRLWAQARVKPSPGQQAGNGFNQVRGIFLPGPGMHELVVDGTTSAQSGGQPFPAGSSWSVERWSRTIGALGFENWQRLQSLRIAVVGCGRLGSHVAINLVRMGVKNVVLLDPDIVEPHSLGEMEGVKESDIGESKVWALARFLERECASWPEPVSICPVDQPFVAAYRKALTADVLVSAADNDAARLATGIVASLYHKVLIDMGTGVLNVAGSDPVPPMGADVRLILPADACIVCFGNLVNYEQALRDLSQNHLLQPANEQEWWEQRRGSLRPLNMLAAALGLQMLCELLMDRIHSSTWRHVSFNPRGDVTFETLTPERHPASPCALCQKAGMGDDGLLWGI